MENLRKRAQGRRELAEFRTEVNAAVRAKRYLAALFKKPSLRLEPLGFEKDKFGHFIHEFFRGDEAIPLDGLNTNTHYLLGVFFAPRGDPLLFRLAILGSAVVNRGSETDVQDVNRTWVRGLMEAEQFHSLLDISYRVLDVFNIFC